MEKVQGEGQGEAGVLEEDEGHEDIRSGDEDLDIVGAWIGFSEKYGREMMMAFFPSLLIFLAAVSGSRMLYNTWGASLEAGATVGIILFISIILIRNWRGIAKMMEANDGNN